MDFFLVSAFFFNKNLKIFDKYVSSKYQSVMPMEQNDNDTKIMIIQGWSLKRFKDLDLVDKKPTDQDPQALLKIVSISTYSQAIS